MEVAVDLLQLCQKLSREFIAHCLTVSKVEDVHEVRGLLLHKLIERRSRSRVVQVSHCADPLVCIYDWCHAYLDHWSEAKSYERFIDYAERNKFNSVLSVPDYREHFRSVFSSIHQLLVKEQQSATNTLSFSATCS